MSEKALSDREWARKFLAERKVTIRINEAQRQFLHQLCRGKVAPEAMAATAFTRGLAILGEELQMDWRPE